MVLLGEFQMGGRGILADADYNCILFLKRAEALGKGDGLTGAAGRVVPGIKIEYDLLSQKIRQADQITVLVRQGKGRGFRSNFQHRVSPLLFFRRPGRSFPHYTCPVTKTQFYVHILLFHFGPTWGILYTEPSEAGCGRAVFRRSHPAAAREAASAAEGCGRSSPSSAAASPSFRFSLLPPVYFL